MASRKNPKGRFVDSDSYALQLFIPRHIKKWKGIPKRFPPPARHPNNKPADAFWTSTLARMDGIATSDWDEWMKGEMPEWRTKEGVVVEVQPGARVAHLKSRRQADDFIGEYGITVSEFVPASWSGAVVPDWPRVYQDFDALHLEGGALLHPAFRTWDAESTAWWNTKDLKDIGRVTLEVS